MKLAVALLLRLAIGVVLGLALFLLLGLELLPALRPGALPPWLVLAVPFAAGIGLAFLLVDGWLLLRWGRAWLPWAEGSRPLPADGERAVKRVIRTLTGPLPYPARARRWLARFVNTLAETLLRRKIRDPWAWTIYALAWGELKQNPALLDETRVALKETDTLTDTAWQVGLSLLRERPDDTGLAILLARGSLTRPLHTYREEQLHLLDDAWLTAYGSDQNLRRLLLPPLTRRFLQARRRDEIAGWIYIDAFVHLSRTAEVVDEMRRTADAIENTGGDPELVANLRALAGAPLEPERAEPVAPGPPGEPGAEVEADEERKDVVFRFHEQHEEESEHEPEGWGEEELMPLPVDEARRKIGPWVWMVAATALLAAFVLSILAITGVLPFTTPVDRQTGAELPIAVTSESPFTVQAAAFPDREKAARMVHELRDRGLDAYLVSTQRERRTFHRVHIGHFERIEPAQVFADSLISVGAIREYYVARFVPGEVPLRPEPEGAE